MKGRRTIEFWREVQGLVERGLSLKEASKRLGLSYSHLSERAAIEGWKLTYRGRPRLKELGDGTRRAAMAREEAEYEEAQAALRREALERRKELERKQARYESLQAELEQQASVMTIDLGRADKLTHRVLSAHSAKLKTMLSELVMQTAEELRSVDVKPKDRAMALASLRAVCDRLYGWDKEPDIGALERARGGAINLELMAVPPELLSGD